jgi:GxxExxY protein
MKLFEWTFGFRADLIVEGKVIVEIESIDAIAPVHRKQLLTYLRLTDKRSAYLSTSMSS